MQYVMNMMQKSLAKLDPEFKAQFFSVDSLPQTVGQTKTATIEELVASQSITDKYTSLKEAIEQTKVYTTQISFDVMKLPYIEEVINNPTKENAEKLVDYYTKILHKLDKMNPKNNHLD